MRKSFASSTFLRGVVTGREIAKAVAPRAICITPRGLTHRRSPMTSGVERSPEESSLAKRNPLKEKTREKTTKRVIVLFIFTLLSSMKSTRPASLYPTSGAGSFSKEMVERVFCANFLQFTAFFFLKTALPIFLSPGNEKCHFFCFRLNSIW